MNDGKKHNVVFIATESDWVYAYDADSSSCQQLWKKNLLGVSETTVPPADIVETGDLTPEIGITSTPVINVNGGLIYVCAKSKDPSSFYFHRLHALNLATGAEPVGPVEITASHFVPATSCSVRHSCSITARFMWPSAPTATSTLIRAG